MVATPTAKERFEALKAADRNMRAVIHRKEKKALIEAGYPFLADGSKDALLFNYWITAKRTEDGHIRMSCQNYCRAIRQDPRIERDRHDRVAEQVKALAQKAGIAIKLTGYTRPTDGNKGRTREITSLLLPEVIHRIVYGRDPDLFKREGLCDAATGAWLDGSQLKIRFQEKVLAASRVNELCEIQEHRDFLDYLNSTLSSYTFRIGRGEINRALSCIDELDELARKARWIADKCFQKSNEKAGRWWKEQADRYQVTAEQALRNLHQVTRFPQPIYSIVQRSPRFYASGVSLLTLPTKIRRALLPRVIELDLVSAQAAIFAKIVGVPRLQKLLEKYLAGKGCSLWAYLLEILALQSKEEREAMKPALKSLLAYALCFGMEETHLLRARRTKSGRNREDVDVNKALRTLGEKGRKRLLADPLMREWLAARERILDEIGTVGGMYDADGRWIYIGMADRPGDPFDARSVLAWVIQSWEVKLLEPVRRMAIKASKNKSHGWKIVLWQHDGFSITCRANDAINVCAEIGASVSAVAERLGIATGIECKYDGILDGRLEERAFGKPLVDSGLAGKEDLIQVDGKSIQEVGEVVDDLAGGMKIINAMKLFDRDLQGARAGAQIPLFRVIEEITHIETAA